MEASSMRMFTRVYSLWARTSNSSSKAGYFLTNAIPIVIRGTRVIAYHLFPCAQMRNLIKGHGLAIDVSLWDTTL